jgi:hypothetical protein
MRLSIQASLLNVSDLERSIEFYRDVCELRPVGRGDRVAALMIDETDRRQVLVLREVGGPHLHAGRGSIGPRLLALEAASLCCGGSRSTRSSIGAHSCCSPDLDAVISGDVAYNGFHPWLAFTDHDKRIQWIASVEQVEELSPRIVVAGHKDPSALDDDPAAILGGTKTYIRDFDRSLSPSHSAQELVGKMIALHGDRGNPYTLWVAAQGVFEQGQGAPS